MALSERLMLDLLGKTSDDWDRVARAMVELTVGYVLHQRGQETVTIGHGDMTAFVAAHRVVGSLSEDGQVWSITVEKRETADDPGLPARGE